MIKRQPSACYREGERGWGGRGWESDVNKIRMKDEDQMPGTGQLFICCAFIFYLILPNEVNPDRACNTGIRTCTTAGSHRGLDSYQNADGDPDITVNKEEAPAYIAKPRMLFSAPEVPYNIV